MKIKIVEFLTRNADISKPRILFMLLVSAASEGTILATINQVAETIFGNIETEFHLFFIYITLCTVCCFTKLYAMDRISVAGEEAVRNIRVRLVDKLRQGELQFLEKTGHSDIYARITQDTTIISQSASKGVMVIDFFLLISMVLLYTAWVSLTGFTIILLLITISSLIFFTKYFEIEKELEASRIKEASLFDALDDVTFGFKEIRINSRKNNEVFADFDSLSREAEGLKAGAAVKFNKNIILTYIIFFVLAGSIVFILPLYTHASSEAIIKLIAALLYIYGPLVGLFHGIPEFAMANVAAANLEDLELRLDASGADITVKEPDMLPDFREIAFHSVSFRYVDKDGFTLFEVGPLDLNIRQGEVLFIVGGNGSGKSTLLKLLTGLYPPFSGGFITLNDAPVSQKTYQTYRELFSVIFADFHLFRKLYGLESPDEQKVRELLKEMDLTRKTRYADRQFSDTDLSTGQRKRLAYIAALLEDKPIYVFDEWAADQDPAFRKYFYDKLIGDLRIMGKTVIAVSHDDRYFNRADRVLKMEEGLLKTIS